MPLYTRFRLGRHLSVRPTSNGLRFSVGPRAARVHFGGSAPAVSTGSGPFTYYQRLDDGPSPAGAAARRLGSAAKAEQARDIAEALLQVAQLHRAEFPPAGPRTAPPPAEPDEAAIRQRHLARATDGISIFRRSQRRAARAAAEEAAAAEVQVARAAAGQDALARQAELDRGWRALLANDEPAVRGELERAFDDNDAPVKIVAVEQAVVALRVHVPGPGVLPERMPGVTAAGNVSLRKMTRTQSAQIYRALVAGMVLVTVKEALAAAPGTTAVRITAVRDAGDGLAAPPAAETLIEAGFDRRAIEGVRWSEQDAWPILRAVARPLRFRTTGQAQHLAALGEPTAAN
jgi:hypothetical protein